MHSLETLVTFLAWCTTINLAILVLTALLLLVVRRPLAGLQARMFGLSEADISRAYFQYLAQYKIVFLVFNLAPYLALRIML
jgi:hypothetical protein